MSVERGEQETPKHPPAETAVESPDESSENDEPISFTEAELREMEAEGLTLGAAIRAIEARLG